MALVAPPVALVADIGSVAVARSPTLEVDRGPMMAFLLTGYGGVERLVRADVPKPSPKRDQVLLRVRATSINDWDWTFVRGLPLAYRPILGLREPKVRILGAEVAGEVAELGSDVQAFRPGDGVYGDISEAGFGAFAEYVCVRADALRPKPASMSFEEAAAIPHAALLARQALYDIGKLRDGQRVLINGAGGGVGTFGIQLARQHTGVEVTGVDSADKLQHLRSLGYDHVIDYRQRDFAQGEQRYDLILDAKSTRSASNVARALSPKGTYVTVGGDTARLLEIAVLGGVLTAVGDKRLRVLALKPNRGLEAMSDLFERGRLRCVIDGPHPFEELPQWVQYFGDARHCGKVVIRVAAECDTGAPAQ